MRNATTAQLIKMAAATAGRAALIESGRRGHRNPGGARSAARSVYRAIMARVDEIQADYPDWAAGHYASDERPSEVRPLLRAAADAGYAHAVYSEGCAALDADCGAPLAL